MSNLSCLIITFAQRKLVFWFLPKAGRKYICQVRQLSESWIAGGGKESESVLVCLQCLWLYKYLSTGTISVKLRLDFYRTILSWVPRRTNWDRSDRLNEHGPFRWFSGFFDSNSSDRRRNSSSLMVSCSWPKKRNSRKFLEKKLFTTFRASRSGAC